MTTEQIVTTDPALPADSMLLEGIDTSREPVFTVSEVAKVFFARSPHWVRWREKKGFFVLDGEDVAGSRTPEGARRYSLSDIEKMTLALGEKGAIDANQVTIALYVVKAIAQLYGYLDPPIAVIEDEPAPEEEE